MNDGSLWNKISQSNGESSVTSLKTIHWLIKIQCMLPRVWVGHEGLGTVGVVTKGSSVLSMYRGADNTSKLIIICSYVKDKGKLYYCTPY